LKKSKTSHSDRSGHIEGDVIQNHEKGENKCKTKIIRVKQTIFLAGLQSLGSFSHMAACKSSSEKIGKMSLIPIFNMNSTQDHTESKSDVIGVHGKLVKYVVHLYKRKNRKKIIFLLNNCPNNDRPILGLKKF
jgi:hypothetical protein